MPVVAVGIAAPALAASTPQQCVTVDTAGCWSCDFYNYNLLVGSYDSTHVQAQTSLTISIPANTTVPAGTVFTFTYDVYRPTGATVNGFGLNGKFGETNWGNWSTSQATWTPTTYQGQAPEVRTTTVKVTLTGGITGPSSLCGGVSFTMALNPNTKIGGYALTSVTSALATVPVCSATTTHASPAAPARATSSPTTRPRPTTPTSPARAGRSGPPHTQSVDAGLLSARPSPHEPDRSGRARLLNRPTEPAE